MIPSYEEIVENGKLISNGNSLHIWDEVWDYNNIRYSCWGVLGKDGVNVDVINK